ncbi:hypothetical protein, partial [Pediococcus pentosaceus]|uniref:hypothetical protein n=1 Tax=Pediococcus pentosaceus TaxID=1255 RepID=UPI0021A732D4
IDCQNFVQFSKVYYRCHINVVSAFDNYLTIPSGAIIVNNFLKVFLKQFLVLNDRGVNPA